MNFLKYLVILLIFSAGCGSGLKNNNAYSGYRNYVSRAEKFRVIVKDGHTVIEIINPWQGASNVNQLYHLFKKGAEIPAGIDSSIVIFVPIEKIVCMSTTYVGMISALDEENSISGVSGTGFIYSESLNKRIENGLIKDVGYESNLNNELILDISPDLIMMYGIGSESAGYVGKIKELGMKVMFNADYLETDPLGKAEWIKLFGALYCKEDVADSIYNSEVEAYNKTKTYISGYISSRPVVLLGLPYKDTWYISPGNSFISKLINDAGGDYLWNNTESSVSMPFGLENVYMRALTADFWLNTGGAQTMEEIAAIDQRLTELPCFKGGRLYNNNSRITSRGGNDFWESGTIYPHIILMDIAEILHPGLFRDHRLFYFKKLI